MNESTVLRGTMTDRVTVFRQREENGALREQLVYENAPCALSRSIHSHTPRLTGKWEEAMESDGTLMLFLPKEYSTCAGDRAEVLREGFLFRGICSASFPYPSHSEATFLLQEAVDAC